jgi:two-component system LytT family sensor kinase
MIAIAVEWLAVWFVTQTISSPPLAVGPTIVIGVVLTQVTVLGYWSVLRGPRSGGRSRVGSYEQSPSDAVVEVSRTLPYLRRGLAGGTADRAAEAILPLSGASRVSITDTNSVLGRAGRRTRSSGASLSPLARSALERQETLSAATSGGGVEVVTPMTVDGEVVGALQVEVDDQELASQERIESLASLVSLHLELATLTQKAQLAADAKLDALRSQINPHFLFNTLNTIANKSRTDTEATRQLLQRLAEFFRYAIRQDGHFAEFANEYYFVRTYVALEQARYDDRLKVHYDVDPQVLAAQVPVLTIQPLVENAVKHGVAKKAGGGTVTLKARADPLGRATRIVVRDDGVGMAPDVLSRVLDGTYKADSGGVGLANISERLQSLFGERYHLDIRSSPGKGTRIDLELPLN